MSESLRPAWPDHVAVHDDKSGTTIAKSDRADDRIVDGRCHGREDRHQQRSGRAEPASPSTLRSLRDRCPCSPSPARTTASTTRQLRQRFRAINAGSTSHVAPQACRFAHRNCTTSVLPDGSARSCRAPSRVDGAARRSNRSAPADTGPALGASTGRLPRRMLYLGLHEYHTSVSTMV